MPALSTFADGTRLDRVAANDYAANVAGKYVKDGDVVELYVEPITAGDVAKNRVHIPDTSLAPATPSEPLVAEVAAYASANTLVDTILYYTGTDTSTDPPTYVYHVDAAGNVTALEDGVSAGLKYTQTFVAGDWVLNGADRELAIPEAAHGLGPGAKSVQVIDAAGDIVGVEINVDIATGDVVVSQPDGLEFSGNIVIF